MILRMPVPITSAALVLFASIMTSRTLVGAKIDQLLLTKTSLKVQHDVNNLLCCHSTSISASRSCMILQTIRGGGRADDEEDNENNNENDDEQNDDDDDDDSGVAKVKQPASGDLLENISQRVVLTITKITTETSMAVTRAFQAAFQTEGKDTGGLVSRVWNTVQRILEAITNPSASETNVEFAKPDASIVGVTSVSESEKPPELNKPSENARNDFGSYLAQSYAVDDARPTKSNKETAPFLGGSLTDALRIARSQARLLVVFIPAAQPSKRGSSTTPDQEAIQSLLSKKAVSAAKKKARKDEPYGSFIYWGAKSGSPDAVAALKRLKPQQTNSKGVKKPILLVAFPKQVISSGEIKLVPVTIAQHHCSPPPSAETMAAWLNTLRKRHAKEYAAMQLELREIKFFQERQEGYRESVVTDAQRQETERKMEAEQIAKERAEKERIQALEQRRKELLASLPEEPTAGSDVVTIALRFTDGRTGQRKFEPTTPLETVFNWVDASYEIERETVMLTTMNGQKSFTWKDCGKQTLADSGIGRMTGLRVTQVKADAPPSAS